MHKKITLLVIIFFTLPSSGYFLSGCIKPCESTCHVIKDLRLEALDNAGISPKEVSDGTVYAKALLLNLAIYDSVKPYYCNRFLDPFINSAYAIYRQCETEHMYTHTDSFSIVSDHDFDATHPAGTDLKDLFYFPDSAITSKQQVYDYYLLKEPDSEVTHTFTMSIQFPNDSVCTVSSQPVKLIRQ